MRKFLIFPLALLSILMVMPLGAGDRNWDYTDKYQRDYDRGFFVELEGWWAGAEGLPNEFATDQNQNVHEVDFNQELSPRLTIGGDFGERVGRFSLSYFNYDENEETSIANPGGGIFSTVFRPEFGEKSSATGRDDLEITTFDFTWTHGMARTRKFDGWWSVGLRYWEFEETLETTFGDGSSWTGINDSKAFGIRVGVGGTYWLVPRFGLAGGLYASMLSGDTDSSIVTVGAAGDPSRFESDDKSFTQLEAELGIIWRAVAGLSFQAGYRYADYMDAVDLPGGPGGEEDARLDGPYASIAYNFGVAKTDTDGDGVLDYLDDCPGTVRGCDVDSHGCPSDFDEDGVCDGLDRCPGTRFGSRVDSNGCSIDSDSDGVADGLDLCPDTPFGCRVDGKGCPRDGDGDGVCDGLDQCPDTRRGAIVDKHGCATDSDGDTVPDSVDRCPNTPRGVEVNEWGCEIELIFQNIQFEFDKAEILPRYEPVLNKVVKSMQDNSGMALRLHGHTDWIYTEEYNLKLSQRRADAVKNYLTKNGIRANRLETVGHGECCPIAPNTTPEGRFKNRRVEFERIR